MVTQLIFGINKNAFVIQLEECVPSKDDVGGSSPSKGTKKMEYDFTGLGDVRDRANINNWLCYDGRYIWFYGSPEKKVLAQYNLSKNRVWDINNQDIEVINVHQLYELHNL